MPDYGSKLTDRRFKRLRARIVKLYQQAYREISANTAEYLKKFEAADVEMRAMLEAGKIKKADYDAWKRGKVFTGKQWEAKVEQMQKTLYHADTVATQIVNQSRFGVFADNANFIGYSLEHGAGVDSSFNLYSAESVTRLVKDKPDLLPPKKKPGRDKSFKWYNGRVNQAISQGIVQGESLSDMAKRIGRDTGESCASTILRNARTAHTSAENAGRMEAMRQAEDKGIKLKKRWMATLDSHTRDTHAELDGQTVDIDEPFVVDGMEIMFPGDPNADPSLVWNCRCTMVEVDPEFPDEMTRIDNETREIIGDMTYREWEKWKRE